MKHTKVSFDNFIKTSLMNCKYSKFRKTENCVEIIKYNSGFWHKSFDNNCRYFSNVSYNLDSIAG